MPKYAPLLRAIFAAALCLMVVLSIPDAPSPGTVSFSYLHFGVPAYTQTAAMTLTLSTLLMMAAHTLLHFNRHMILQTIRAAGVIVLSLVLTAWGCFGLGHMAAIAALPVTALVVGTAVRRTKLTCRDLNRAFAYIHGLVAAALTVLRPEASYLFTFSALMLMAIQLLITFQRDAMDWGLELLAAALYMPILIPAISAAGIGWSQGLLFALGIFPVGVWLAERGMNCEIK